MKKAFSLVELIVVVAIIGILAAVLMGTFSGGSDAARAARCMGNMRNLGAACQSAAVATGHYPPAGSFETLSLSTGQGGVVKQFNEIKGWISWNSQGAYQRDAQGYLPNSHKASASWNLSCYSDDEEGRWYAITNGILWKYVGGTHATYVCPVHAKVMSRLKPNWSYALNAFFKWDHTHGSSYAAADSSGVKYYGQLSGADRRLLFAEIPFLKGPGLTVPEGTDETTDSILQYSGCLGGGSPESIGFNHKSGKRYYANICFADGHVEKLAYPKAGMSETEAQQLTKWLCEGKEVSFDGSKYEELTNASVK